MPKRYIEWLGTGSGLNPTLGNTSFMVKAEGRERTLLVDCGATVPQKLISSGNISNITDVIITHLHGDHFHGLEGLGFFNYFALRRRGDDMPNIYVANVKQAVQLESALGVSMGLILDDEGEEYRTMLGDFFNVHINSDVEVPGLPKASLFPTEHVGSMENYGVMIGDDVFYSGDTVELPRTEPRLIFQDCQFFETKNDVHISYDKLKRELPLDVRAKTYLVHLGGGWDKKDAKADGFAGFVKPGDIFEL